MKGYDNIDWNAPNIYLFFIGYSIILIPLFKRELLVDKKSFLIILKVSMISFLLAIIIDLLNYDKKLWGLLSLYMPLYIVGLYRFLRFIFVSIKKREPIDTAFDLKGITPWSDRLFNIFFFCMATIIPMIVLGLKSIHR